MIALVGIRSVNMRVSNPRLARRTSISSPKIVKSFTRRYGSGGPEYSRNSYDTRLGAAFQKYALGALPDLVVRTAQIYLIYLGYNPGSVNGITGRFTRSALNEFQQQHGLPITTDIGDAQLSALKGEVEKLEP